MILPSHQYGDARHVTESEHSELNDKLLSSTLSMDQVER